MIAAHPVQALCYLIAVVLLALAAFGVSAPRLSLGWLGMVFFVLAFAIMPMFSTG